VLNSSASASQRAAAAAFNGQLNSLLQSKVAQYNQVNGVSFNFDHDGLYNYQFTSRDVSHLDCFHPSKQGQHNIAATVWNDAALGGSTPGTSDDAAPVVVANSWTANTNNDPGQAANPGATPNPTPYVAPPPSYSYQTNVFRTDRPASKHVWMQSYGYDGAWRGCSYLYGAPCYVGYVRETPTTHNFEVSFYVNGRPDPAEYYDYWRMWIQPVSTRGVASGSYYIGPWN
jgi:hypothetical protein